MPARLRTSSNDRNVAPSLTHGLQFPMRGRDLDQDVRARRQSEPPDALRIEVWPLVKKGERSLDVLLPVPAEGVVTAFALAAAPRVVEEHPVPVPGEQPGMAHGPRPVAATSVDEDHSSLVRRCDVPPGESDAVRGVECNGVVGGARWLADRFPVLVGLHHGATDREQEDVEREGPGQDRDEAIRPPTASRRCSLAAVSERYRESEANENDTRDGSHDARVVAVSGFD